MDRQKLLVFRKGDLLAIAAVVAVAVLTLLAYVPIQKADQQGIAQVYQQGTLLCELPLNQSAEFTVSGDFENVIRVENGSICFAQSTCPGNDCVHLGSASKPGRTLVCLPNRVEIRIVPLGEMGENDVDFVVR